MLRVAFIVSNNTNISFKPIIVKNHCCSIITPYQILTPLHGYAF